MHMHAHAHSNTCVVQAHEHAHAHVSTQQPHTVQTRVHGKHMCARTTNTHVHIQRANAMHTVNTHMASTHTHAHCMLRAQVSACTHTRMCTHTRALWLAVALSLLGCVGSFRAALCRPLPVLVHGAARAPCFCCCRSRHFPPSPPDPAGRWGRGLRGTLGRSKGGAGAGRQLGREPGCRAQLLPLYSSLTCRPAGMGGQGQAQGSASRARTGRPVPICPGTPRPPWSVGPGGLWPRPGGEGRGPPTPRTHAGGLSSRQSGPDRGAGPSHDGQGPHQRPRGGGAA